MTSLTALHRPDVHPLSSGYDPQWLVDHAMGPNPLWLLEDLSADLVLRPGMQVLDLGCGTGLTSVFLAREHGVHVQAAEHWLPAEDNAARFRDAGVDDRVRAVAAEAHDLPFERGRFDAVIGVDSYHYFGTDDLYIGYITQFLAPGGQLAVAVPSLRRELRELGGIPQHLRAGIGWEALSLHTADWWRFQWEQSGLVEIVAARPQPRGWDDWRLWCEVCAEHASNEDVRQASATEGGTLDADGGELLTFALVTGRVC